MRGASSWSAVGWRTSRSWAIDGAPRSSSGPARIAVTGQPGAGIPIGTLVEGGSLTAVGIVRLAYPSASDARPTLLPRSPADLTVGPAPGGGSATTTAAGSANEMRTGATTGSASAVATGVPFADLADLATLDGQTVRVGGLITDLTGDGFRLDDGTAIARIVLSGPAAAYRRLVEPGDAINLTGRVAILDDGSFGVLVDDVDQIVIGADPGAGAAMAAAAPGPSGPPGLSGSGRRPAEPAGRAGGRARVAPRDGRRTALAGPDLGRIGGRDGASPASYAAPVARSDRPSPGGYRWPRGRPGRPERGLSVGHRPSEHVPLGLTLLRRRDYPRPSFAPAKQPHERGRGLAERGYPRRKPP